MSKLTKSRARGRWWCAAISASAAARWHGGRGGAETDIACLHLTGSFILRDSASRHQTHTGRRGEFPHNRVSLHTLDTLCLIWKPHDCWIGHRPLANIQLRNSESLRAHWRAHSHFRDFKILQKHFIILLQDRGQCPSFQDCHCKAENQPTGNYPWSAGLTDFLVPWRVVCICIVASIWTENVWINVPNAGLLCGGRKRWARGQLHNCN